MGVKDSWRRAVDHFPHSRQENDASKPLFKGKLRRLEQTSQTAMRICCHAHLSGRPHFADGQLFAHAHALARARRKIPD